MRKIFRNLTTALIVALPMQFSGTNPVLADEYAILTKAELFTHTNDDNKDHDTGIHITVKTHDGSTLIAFCNNCDSSGDDSTEYNNGSNHTLNLVTNAPGITKAACRNFKVHLWQQTNGNDTWKFNASVRLYFSDGTNLNGDRNDITLKNNGASVDFEAP